MRCAHERGCPLLSVPAGAFRSILLVDNKKLAALESIEPALTVRIRGEFDFFSRPTAVGYLRCRRTRRKALRGKLAAAHSWLKQRERHPNYRRCTQKMPTTGERPGHVALAEAFAWQHLLTRLAASVPGSRTLSSIWRILGTGIG